MRKSRSQAKTVFTGELMVEFRELLLRERASLVRQIKSLSDASLTSSRQAGEELADVGSDDFIRETELYLLSEEGLCVGGSSGINVAGAIRLARELGPGHTIVTVLCDYGNRYQSKLFNPAFLRDKGLPVPCWLDEAAPALPSVFEDF